MFLPHKRPIMRALFCYPDGSGEKVRIHAKKRGANTHMRKGFSLCKKMIFDAHMNEKLCYTEIIIKMEDGCKGTARISFFWTAD